jgi:site-specific DNA-methyltransferase (adenine-specific)
MGPDRAEGKPRRDDNTKFGKANTTINPQSPLGRFPANFIHDGSPEVVQHFPGIGDKSASRFFYVAKASKADRDEGLDGFEEKETAAMAENLVSGQRLSGNGAPIKTPIRKNIHSTVKPTDLMRYLCRLVTPSGGVVLDPFMGSGSTGKAAALEGFKFVGCELSPEYFAIAEARIFAAHL